MIETAIFRKVLRSAMQYFFNIESDIASLRTKHLNSDGFAMQVECLKIGSSGELYVTKRMKQDGLII